MKVGRVEQDCGQATPSTSPPTLRHDIQALRALAVGSVVLYHLWPNVISGGYVGVDVFFVISGFLITSHLLRELDTTGGVGLARFWARRATRLVPASVLVLLVTSIAILAWVPDQMWTQFFSEVVASALLFENWRLAYDAVDYLAVNNSASPSQHFWTLSAEEQFYITLPLALAAAAKVGRVLRANPRRLVAVVLVVAVAASFAHSVLLTEANPGVAYFSTFTRAWEFGAGALFAFAAAQRRDQPIVAWGGVAAIVAVCFAYDDATAFPGWRAAVPVVATLAILAAGSSSLGRVGKIGPVALLGKVSYSAYLWHWPLIVLVPYITGHALTDLEKVVIGMATVLIAWVSTTFVEDPIRYRPRELGPRRPRMVALWSVAASVVVLLVAVAASILQSGTSDQLSDEVVQVVLDDPDCLGAAARDPERQPCENPDLDGVLIPDPAIAASDDANEKECWGRGKVCSVGPAAGWSRRLLAVGDSHNNSLLGVYGAIAERQNWKIDVNGLGGCYLTTARQAQPSESEEQNCYGWQAEMTRLANEAGYDAIIVTHSRKDRPVIAESPQERRELTVRGLVEAWMALPDVPVIAIIDNPAMPADYLTCVQSERTLAGDRCAVPRSEALRAFDGQLEAAGLVPKASIIDMTWFYCSETLCPPVIGNVLVYRDASHLSETYARTLTPYIERQMLAILPASR